MALPPMRTPAEFIDYYYNQLKTAFANNNIKLSKTGFVGFILNILGNTQFDNKQYYDSLFSEAFPALSVNDTNLRFHAGLHGFSISLASAASITSGYFNLNMTSLPSPRAGLISRTIRFGSATSNIGFDIRSLPYTADAVYVLTSKIVNGVIISYYAQIAYPTGQTNSAVQLSTPRLPIINAKQYRVQTYSEVIPFYPIGSHYTIIIPAISTADMIHSIASSLVLPDNSTVTLTAATNKTGYGSNDNVLFYSVLPNRDILIELGSGAHGAHVIENSTISIQVKTTAGASGNIAPPGVTDIKMITDSAFAQTVTVTDSYASGDVSTVIPISAFLSAVVDAASGGVDVLTGVSLRDALFQYIQTRDSIVTQTDYANTLAPLFQFYAISFNKSKIASNTISLYIPLFDKYQNPYPTSTVNMLQTNFEAGMFSDITHGIRTVFEPSALSPAGSTMISPFLYVYDPLYNMYNGVIVNQDTVYTYTSVVSYDPAGLLSTTAKPPYISATITYHHNSISPYSIIKISSYEDISQYITGGSISLTFTNYNISYTTAGVHFISNIGKHTGVQSVLVVGLNQPSAGSPALDIISLTSTAGFPIMGTIVIGTEQITYTGKDDTTNTLTGVIRGAGAVAHAANTDVFDITISNSNVEFIFGKIVSDLTSPVTLAATSITISDSSLFPPFGSIVIGSEEMSYTSITGTTMNGIIRGVNGTVPATHAAGDIVNEKTTATASYIETLGFLDTSTSVSISMNNADIATSTGFVHNYTFVFDQTVDIRDSLQVKQYNVVGLTESITSDVLSTDSVIPIGTTSGFTTTGSITIGTEEMSYSGITALTLTGVTRGINGTTALVHSRFSTVRQIVSENLEVPVIDSIPYATGRSYILSSIFNNYKSISLPSNRAMSDEVQLKLINTEYVALNFLQLILTNGSHYVSSGATGIDVNAPSGIVLPLKVSMALLMNKVVITSTRADVTADVDTLMLTIAQELSNKYTGTQIRVSDADIIFIAKQIAYIDDANVTFTDSSATPVSIVNNELNTIPESAVLSNMLKSDRLNYNPILWHWDINNIAITYTVE